MTKSVKIPSRISVHTVRTANGRLIAEGTGASTPYRSVGAGALTPALPSGRHLAEAGRKAMQGTVLKKAK